MNRWIRLSAAVGALRIDQHGVDGHRVDLPFPPGSGFLRPADPVARVAALEHEAFDTARARLDNSMKIALISPLCEAVPPRLYGGTERIVAHLADALVSLGQDVTLFASADEGESWREIASYLPAISSVEVAVLE